MNPEDNPLLNCAFPDHIMWQQATEEQRAQAVAVEQLRIEAKDSSTMTGAEWLQEHGVQE